MRFTLSELLPHLLTSFANETELLQAIEEISRKFTTERKHIADYLKDPRLVSAYTAFYLTTNIPKLEAVLRWMDPVWIDELKQSTFIDLGAGPGTFSIAWKLLGGRGDFYQIEQSLLMRQQGKKIWEAFFREPLRQSQTWEGKQDSKKFLLFGHSANEMSVDTVLSYIKDISPEHILFIEPGTKEFFEKMLLIRHSLIEKHYHVLYPCPRPQECPMKGSKDWCHQFVHVKQEADVERISQRVRLDRKLLPLTVQAFSKISRGQNPQERLVRVLPETKFSHEWEVCHDNLLEHYQVMKRDLSKADSKALGELLAGEGIVTEVIKKVEQTKRVRLQKVIKL
jgi:ribosomal protein RSM22 (predicted rRNA methylase)